MSVDHSFFLEYLNHKYLKEKLNKSAYILHLLVIVLSTWLFSLIAPYAYSNNFGDNGRI